MTLEILGTNYELIVNDESLMEINADGVCRPYEKVIRIAPVIDMLDDDSSTKEKRLRNNEVLRHEIIHAFFNECGLSEYYENETLVNWLAVQFPKLMKIFRECGCGSLGSD